MDFAKPTSSNFETAKIGALALQLCCIFRLGFDPSSAPPSDAQIDLGLKSRCENTLGLMDGAFGGRLNLRRGQRRRRHLFQVHTAHMHSE